MAVIELESNFAQGTLVCVNVVSSDTICKYHVKTYGVKVMEVAMLLVWRILERSR